MNDVALITGSSRGIGATTAKLLASRGYQVCVNYRNNSKAAAATVAEIQDAGGNAISVQADVSNETDVLRLFEQIDDRLGRITALVNNAGRLFTQTKLLDLTAERINAVMINNVTSQFLCCREAVKRMSTTGGGSGGAIVNLSSVAALTGAPGEYVDYAASKGAVDTLTIGLSAEVAAEGIRVNGIRPGFIYTDMHTDGGEPNRVDRVKSMVPMLRGGHVSEVAAAIAWLLSAEASYTTGTFINVSGGRR